MSDLPSGKKCMVGGCQNIAVARDLCDMHRKRQDRHGHVLETRPADWGARERHPLYTLWNGLMRAHRADVVVEWHDLWAFASAVGTRPSKRHKLTRIDDAEPYGPMNVYWREPLRSPKGEDDRASAAAASRAWYAANKDRALSGDMRKRYGITWDDYQKMLAEQNGVCAICHQPETRVDHRTKQVSRLAIDHCHKTEKVRGLLCHHCNNALGCFDDNLAEMASAIVYLAKHSAEPAAVLMAAISNLQAAIPAAGTA